MTEGLAEGGHVRERIRGFGGGVNAAATRAAQAGRRAFVKAPTAGWARELLARLPRPEAPATGTWTLSVGALIAMHPRVPSGAGKLLSPLRRFGEVTVGPEEVGFDGERVTWKNVVEVRMRGVVPLLLDGAVEKEIERFRGLLPPVPGRKWIVARAAEVLLTLVTAALGRVEDRGPQVPCEIVYRTPLRRSRQLSAGFLGTAIMAALPEAAQSIVATAKARGIPVVSASSEALTVRVDRAERLRESSTALLARMRALATAAEDEADAPAAVEEAPATEEYKQPPPIARSL